MTYDGQTCPECGAQWGEDHRPNCPTSPDPRTVVDDETFMENVREALSNGYERVCANCGVGTAGDDMDIHERACPEFDEGMLR